MAYYDQGNFDVRCEWDLHGLERIRTADVVVIVDVLSFTTSVDIALSRGVTVFPYSWHDETAVAYAEERNAELAGSRLDPKNRYSLAPSSLVEAPVSLRLVLPSPNGSTLAFHAVSSGAKVVAGSLRNASAVATWAQALGKSIPSLYDLTQAWSNRQALLDSTRQAGLETAEKALSQQRNDLQTLLKLAGETTDLRGRNAADVTLVHSLSTLEELKTRQRAIDAKKSPAKPGKKPSDADGQP